MGSAERGMTLIEVLMALSVLAIGIMSLLTLIPTTTRLINDSNEYEIARHATEMKIIEIRGAGIGAAPSYDGTTFSVSGLTAIAVGTDCGSATVPDGPDGTKEAVVVVLWRGTDKVNKQIEIRTLIGP